MSKGNNGNDLYSDLVKTIREKIEEQINLEYTEMKLHFLDNLDYRLEAKRNKVVKSVLDSIDIAFSKDVIGYEPTILIKIIKKN